MRGNVLTGPKKEYPTFTAFVEYRSSTDVPVFTRLLPL